jgi:methionyl-tRNA formyltransferase
VLLAGAPAGIDGYAETRTVESVDDARESLAGWGADLVVSFGTGLIGAELIAAVPRLLNLHGGNPEEYRGLDTHLWAIYHRDFANLVTVLHEVDADLDTGALVGQAAVEAEQLHELRARNTERCVELTVGAAASLAALGSLPSRPQVRRGRYYSFMPAVLKDVCVRRWAEAA